MAAKIPEMNTDFARWYTEEFMDDGTVREARWKAVVAMAAASNWARVEVLVRLAYGVKDPAGYKNEKLTEAHNALVAAAKVGDQHFDPASSVREMQFLSAATLVRLFSSQADPALAVTTASFAGNRKVELPMDLPALAARGLVALTSRQHARADVATLKIEAPTIDYDSEREVADGETPLTDAEERDALRDAISDAIDAAVGRQNEITRLLARRMELGEEELQMLWWLVGSHSVTLDRPFSKIGSAALPIVLAKELGGMTTVTPGPVTIRALLAKAGVGSKSLAVRDAVNAVDLEWAKTASASAAVSPVTTPLHFALEKRAEVADDDAWQASWSALSGLQADVSLPAAQLAELFYREYLFLHVSG